MGIEQSFEPVHDAGKSSIAQATQRQIVSD
jgi:hypothetical protein